MNEPKEPVIKHDLGSEVGEIETNAMLEFTPETSARLRQGRPTPEVQPTVEATEASKKDKPRKLKLK